MANRTITDPSGNKYTIFIPDEQNPPKADILEFVQQEVGAGRLKPDEPEPGFFSAENWTPEGSVGDIYETFTGGVQDAATFGLADKVRDVGRVAGRYLTPESLGGEAGWGMTALQKAIMDRWGSSAEERALREARNPKTALAGSVLGWMANPPVTQATRWAMGQKAGSGLAEPGVMQRVFKEAITPQSKKLTAAKLAGVGAGTGGLYGLGKEGTLEAGATHAALGGGLSLGMSGLVNVGGWGLKKLNDYFLKNAGQRQTAVDMRLLAQALEADGWTIQTASKELERLGPRAVLADLGDATARLTFKAYTKAPKEIRKGFQERQQGVGEPGFKTGGQAQTIDERLGKISPKSLRETKAELSQSRAQDLYDEAEKANLSMMSPEINRILNTTAGKKAWKMAKESMRDAGENLAVPSKGLTEIGREQGIVTGAGIADDGLKLRFLNEVKKHLWDLEQSAMKSGPFGDKPTQASRVISENRNKFTAELDKLDVTATPIQNIPISKIRHGESALPGGKLEDPGAEKFIGGLMKKGKLKPIEVLPDEQGYMVYDGSHRLEAAIRRGDKTIPARIVGKDAPKIQGAYARARAVEGERLQGLDMLKMGKDFRTKGSVEEMEELLAQASPEQIEAFRTGYVSDLRDVVLKTKDWIDVTKKIQGSEMERKKLKLLFDTPEEFKSYMAMLANEAQMYGTGARVMQGSKTAEMTEAVKQGEVDPGRMLQGFMDIKRGLTSPTQNPGAIFRGAATMGKGLYDHATMTPTMANRLAKSLMGRDLSGLEQVYTPMVQDRNLQSRLARLLMQSGYQPGREYYLGRQE